VFERVKGSAQAAARWLPRSLRAQFTLVASVLAALIVAGGITAVAALHQAGEAARRLAADRGESMQVARDLLQYAMQIQWQAHRMMTLPAGSPGKEMHESMQRDLASLDALTARLASGDDAGVLDLHYAAQLFASSAQIIASLRESTYAGDEAARPAAIESASRDMAQHAAALVAAARGQSDRVIASYQDAVDRVADASQRQAYVVAAWLAFGVLIALYLARRLVGRHVLARLQAVSRSLRMPDSNGDADVRVAVSGDDEIGEMARAVEQFLADRRELAITRSRLEEEQQRLQAIFDNTTEAIVVLQHDVIVQANPAARELFGAAGTSLVGRRIGDVLPGAELTSLVLARGASDVSARGADGREVPVEISLSRLPGHDAASYVIVARDATLHREAEQHLRDARDAAAAARATQAAFLANMSHELRTPLNAVLGYGQILRLQSNLTDKQRSAVDTIMASGQHLLALISDLIDISRCDAGKLELLPAAMPLVDCLRVTADIVRVKAEEAGLEFVFDVSGDVPATVLADERRLRQVLLNLLSNAVKFTDRGEVSLSVRVLKRHAGAVTLGFIVADSGVGIGEADLCKLFHPFEQVGDLERRAAGSGLGLAISRELVRLMGGDICVSSVTGRGSTFGFELELPIVAASMPSMPVPQAIVGYEGPRRRVLVVDDMPANRLVAIGLLAPLGFDVDEAGNGRQALERARAALPDLVLMDLVMPEMDGREAMSAMAADPELRGVPVIAVSANVDAGRTLQAAAFLAKPLDRSELLREVERLLGLRWRTQAQAGTVPA
jgi:PAS domain S-box-containing protein